MDKSARQELMDLLETLPDDMPMEAVLVEVHFKASVLRGIADAERGAVVSHEEVGAAIARWRERGHVGPIFDELLERAEQNARLTPEGTSFM